MPKRKLLTEMSKRHYRRLKNKARNITIDKNINTNINELSIDSDNTNALQNSRDIAYESTNNVTDVSSDQNSNNIIAQKITDVNNDHDQTNITFRNEQPQQCINTSDNENVHDLHYDSTNLENLLSPITFTSNKKENDGHTSPFTDCSIRDDLTNWAAQFHVSHVAVTAFLSVLRKHGFDSNLLKNSKTLMKTPKCTNIRKVAPGEYFHNGLKSEIIAFLKKRQDDIDLIEVQISIDGLPISDSSTNQLWPILGSVAPSLSNVFMIGCYFGSVREEETV